MATTFKFIPLFKVTVLHRFFLNKGNADYFLMNEKDKAQQLGFYDLSNFMVVLPTDETALKLKGYKLLFKMVSDGFVVFAKVETVNENCPFIPFDNDLCLTFTLQLNDVEFYHYTNLKLSNAGKISYFSNRRLSTESLTFPLLNNEGDHQNIDENFVLSETSSKTEIDALSIRDINKLFGIVRIHLKADNSNQDIVDAMNFIKTPIVNFEILFDNRKTIWRYIFSKDQTVDDDDAVQYESITSNKILVSKVIQPLTQKGFIVLDHGGVDLPNPDTQMIVPDELANKEYSEIYM